MIARELTQYLCASHRAWQPCLLGNAVARATAAHGRLVPGENPTAQWGHRSRKGSDRRMD